MMTKASRRGSDGVVCIVDDPFSDGDRLVVQDMTREAYSDAIEGHDLGTLRVMSCLGIHCHGTRELRKVHRCMETPGLAPIPLLALLRGFGYTIEWGDVLRARGVTYHTACCGMSSLHSPPAMEWLRERVGESRRA